MAGMEEVMAKSHEPKSMAEVDIWSEGRRQYSLFECPQCGKRKQYTLERSRGGVTCTGTRQAAQPFNSNIERPLAQESEG